MTAPTAVQMAEALRLLDEAVTSDRQWRDNSTALHVSYMQGEARKLLAKYRADAGKEAEPTKFQAVKRYADSVLKMVDERMQEHEKASHPFNNYFGDTPEVIVAAKACASELREVRYQVRLLGDAALLEIMRLHKPQVTKD